MKQLSFGEWVIEADIEATKEIYNNFVVTSADSQVNRNYIEYCKNLLPEEKEFFNSLGIIPERCEVTGMIIDRKDNCEICGDYYILGKIIKPEVLEWPAEEENTPDYSFNIGRFEFYFWDMGGSELPFMPSSEPIQSIVLSFSICSIPWLLDEKCEGKFVSLNSHNPFVKLRFLIRNKMLNKVYRDETEQTIIELLTANDIPYERLHEKDVKKHMKEWFAHFVPDMLKAKAKPHCFGTRKWGGYLWHAFSYEFTPCKHEEQARQAYDDSERGECVLLMHNEKLAFIIEHSSGLTSEVLNHYMDIFITDMNFKWTYVHTHEGELGPYFATRQI